MYVCTYTTHIAYNFNTHRDINAHTQARSHTGLVGVEQDSLTEVIGTGINVLVADTNVLVTKSTK